MVFEARSLRQQERRDEFDEDELWTGEHGSTQGCSMNPAMVDKISGLICSTVATTLDIGLMETNNLLRDQAPDPSR